MNRAISLLGAAVYAVSLASPVAFAQDQKKAQVHKGTPEQGTVQKKEHQKSQKKDGTGGQMKKGDAK